MRYATLCLMLAATACDHEASAGLDESSPDESAIPPACAAPPNVIINVPLETAITPSFAVAPPTTFHALDAPMTVLSFSVIPWSYELRMMDVALTFHNVCDGHTEDVDICTVFVCDEDADGLVVDENGERHLGALDLVGGTTGSGFQARPLDPEDATATDGEPVGLRLPVRVGTLFVLFGQVRSDAPPGRYRFHLEDVGLAEPASGREHHFPGYPAMGPEIVVPER